MECEQNSKNDSTDIIPQNKTILVPKNKFFNLFQNSHASSYQKLLEKKKIISPVSNSRM
jgi:hypothetical protein